ncbi:putative toxin-antitoxin system toxin component, PIN family [Thermus tengchongensis]|uniref:Putative toxin-antitoxin system toxin component, PIN family n=1 Tax=Thermus tengchongensis TaxID=1214928 RepID=A0A4Y9FBV2_9DEIN|nr:putative toxin-antitoxin system toxin component, PIN family [Thermus tengchongensis]TFU26070.1 putative toxin-antitoxin system toxin component, PIN family [Thermus tengchongensis]
MIRAVLDPGMLVAALLSSQGAPAQLVRLLVKGCFQLVLSPKLLEETERILKRPKFRDHVNPEEVQDYLAFLVRWGELVPDPPESPGLCPDPGDDYLVALARASRARVLVSGDRHLLGLSHPEPPVLTPRAFLELLESLGPQA